jgi:hypothetical protein
VAEHRAIFLVEDVATDFDDAVGADSDDVAIEGGVVELAE